MTSATDELRRLLDERGVKWKAPASYDGSNRFDTVVGDNWFHEYDCGITVHCLTPEQAVEATLGSAVRHPKPHEQWTTVLLSEIAWDRDDRWPDYLSVAHDTHGEWRVYVPEVTLGREWREVAERAQAENAKLRELVKDIHTLATDYGVCVQYPYCDAWDEKLAVAEKQMRELGIEVPS